MRKLKTILLFSLLLIIFSPAIALAQSSPLIMPADGFKYLCNDLSQYKDNESFCASKGQRVPTTAEINATVLPCGSPANKCGESEQPVCCYGGLIIEQKIPPKKPLFVIPVPEVKIPTVELTEANCDLNPQTNAYVCAVPWIGEYINGIYKYGINIAGILAALVLMGGGLLWLISGGDASKITKAKEMIIGSVTGLIILMSSYIILTQINPDLVKMKSISLGYIAKQDAELAKAKLGTEAENYSKMGCPTEAELSAGVQFYATGYFKMPWQENQDKRYLCMVHMQGSCPNGVDNGSDCVDNGKPIFSGYPNYKPCQQFTQAQYNSSYFNQANLIVGQTIAGPIKCGGSLAMSKQVCFNGHTYTITDSGGGIIGKRIDILSSSEAEAINNTKVGTLKSGPCQ